MCSKYIFTACILNINIINVNLKELGVILTFIYKTLIYNKLVPIIDAFKSAIAALCFPANLYSKCLSFPTCCSRTILSVYTHVFSQQMSHQLTQAVSQYSEEPVCSVNISSNFGILVPSLLAVGGLH